MGVERAPTLLYLSDHSTPVVRVAAAVSVSDLTTTPDSLRANLLITGTAIDRYIAWPWSPECATSAGCRIVVPLATAGYSMPTGVYDYTLEVRAGSGSPPMGSATGSVVVVDNRASAFGQGWWLEGHERLMVAASDSSRMLWIGGDGSSRVYQRQVDASIWTVSAMVTRPDTIRRVSGEYVRKLRNGASVTFDASLRHVRTTNRQGHVTRFYYHSNSTRLDYLEVPVPTSQPARRFYLSYDSTTQTRVTAIRAPSQSGSGTRNDSLFYNGNWQLTRIKEPSGDSVRFQYSGTATSLMTRRFNRLSDSTTYTYEAWGTVTQVSIHMRGSNPAITTTFCAAEGRSLATCSGDGGGYRPQPAVRTVTRIDGPRSDVNDVTRFFVGRFGAPDTLVDALGATVRLERGNSTFPALVTRLTDAAGLVSLTAYNNRGLPETLTVEAPYGGGSATTNVSWDTKWDMATQVQSPTSELVTLAVESSTGNRLWQRRGSDDSTKVSFEYDGYNRLTAVTTQLTGAQATFAYDSVRGNLNSSTSALGIETTMASDAAGADTVVCTPIDGTLTMRQHRIYDQMGRVVRTEDVAPSVEWSLSPASGDTGTAPARTLVVKHEFDAEGQMLSVTRFTWPDSSSGKTAQTWSTYDAAGRVIEQGELHTPGSRTMTYDPAGNLVTTTSRRGLTVTQSYDPVGRVLARATPAITFADSVCTECNVYGTLGPDTVFIPTIGTPIDNFHGSRKIVVPAEVTVFGYDAAGRMVQADNAFARIRRGYFPNGALKADTAWVRTYAEDAVDPWPSSQRTVLTYAYDLSGRRTSRTDQGTGNQTYAYDALGQLSSTTDQAVSGGSSVTVHYKYDQLGRLVADSIAAPASVLARWTYDVAGRPTLRVEEGFTDSLWYDERGKRTKAWGRVLMNDAYATGTIVAYDGFGQIAATANTDTERPAVTDEFRFDGVGNVLVRHANKLSNEANTEARDSSVYTGHQLTSRVGAHFPNGRKSPLNNYSAAIRVADSLGIAYDSSGNVTTQVLARREWVNGISDGYGRRDITGLSITTNWYDANEQLRFTQLTTMPTGFSHFTRISEYRYDALGRRIAVRAMVDSIASCSNEYTVTPIRCQQEYLVTTWDGDQVLTESRTLGGWQLSDQNVGTSGSGDWWGTVRYTQTGAIDAPRVLWRNNDTPRILHRNWRGSVAGATFASSGSADDATVWPAVNDVWYSPDSRQSAPESNKWMGSLVTDGRDATGTLYRRNRYYDPTSGRFTQEDPIGLDGGLNLYGYAGGDPINFSDPFGLCPASAGGDGKTEEMSDCPRGSSGWWAWRDARGEGSRLVNNARGLWAAMTSDNRNPWEVEGREVVIAGVPSWLSGHRFVGGMNNLEALRWTRVGRYRVRVDAEIGGSALGQIHVHVQGMEKVLINSIDDLVNLPRAVRDDARVLAAVEKAVMWFTRQRTP